MSDIVTVPLHQQRDIATVTAEIRMINQQTVQYVVRSVVEIGRRLVEAKSMLPHGQWGTWLRDEVGFSQSTAQNYMRIFEEYSADQLTLDGAVANSQTLGNLSYTKALKLLALPAEDREEFVKTHDVEDMSTRALERALREMEEAKQAEQQEKQKREKAEDRVAALKDRVEALESDLEGLKLAHAEEFEDEAAKTKAAEEKAKAAAMRERMLAERVEALRKESAKAAAAEKAALEKLEKLKKNPPISKEVEDKLKADAKAEAAKEAEAELARQKKAQEELQEQIQKAQDARKEAEEAQRKAEEEAAQIRKQLATASPEMVTFKLYFRQFQEAFMEARRSYEGICTADPAAGEKLRAAILKALENCKESMEGQNG